RVAPRKHDRLQKLFPSQRYLAGRLAEPGRDEVVRIRLLTATSETFSGPAAHGKIFGRRGMGAVYRARHVCLDRLVALKLLRGSSKRLARFRAEALVDARLHQPSQDGSVQWSAA